MSKEHYVFRYRVRNWPEYNRALVARGSLTFWFDEESIAVWRQTKRTEGSGRPRLYSDTAIQCALVLRCVFVSACALPRACSLPWSSSWPSNLPVPDYSTVSRRQGSLDPSLSVSSGDRPRHVVIDTTGLRVYGAGGWHVRKHRRGRRRAWRKLHLGVDETTKEIVAVDMTPSNVHDSQMFAQLLDQVAGSICQVSGDRAYDTRACYESALERDAIVTIPPRRNARVRASVGVNDWRTRRNATLGKIRDFGRYEWRASSGCTRQSLAENAVSRFKGLLGPGLSARRLDNQRVEAIVKCAVLNRMTSLGMPDSVRI